MARVFSDFNVLVSPDDRINKRNLLAKLQAVFKLGYEVVALNTVIEDDAINDGDGGDDEETVTSKKKKKRKKDTAVIPEPIRLTAEDVNALGQVADEKCKILNRVTFVMSNASQTPKLTFPTVKNYDIIAVQPTTEKVLQLIARSTDFDIIALNFNERLGFYLKFPTVKLALSNGIAFEISYVPLIKEGATRRQVLANGQQLVERCNGKNILISSGANRGVDFRGPYDVANLGLLFGLKASQAKDALSTNCRALLLHCESRRLGRSAVLVTPIADVEVKDKWKTKFLAQRDDEEKEGDDDDDCQTPPLKKIKTR